MEVSLNPDSGKKKFNLILKSLNMPQEEEKNL